MSAFRPGILPSLVVAVLLPLLVTLGFWQLSRAEEKRALLAQHEASQQAAPVSLTELEQRRDLNAVRIRLRGQFDAAHSLLLDNRTHNGQAGVELLQPFYDQASGLWVLLNRGWLAWPDRRTPPQFTTPEQPLELVGQVYLPPGTSFQLQADQPGNGWPRLVTRIEPEPLWQQLGRGGLAYEVRLESGPASYLTQWPVVAMSPEKHTGYAVQWFALAAALCGLYLYLGWRNAREQHHEHNHESPQHPL
ncbi:SURF1 family protein [Pseudomonas sp. Marseille-Q8238]